MDNEALLHLYAQAFWHEDAVIVGNRAGLLALADAIVVAVMHHEGDGTESIQAVTSDGEGYTVRVRLMDEDGMAKLKLPYTDKDARGDRGELP